MIKGEIMLDGSRSWVKRSILIDSGADISLLLCKDIDKDDLSHSTVSGIGGSQKAGKLISAKLQFDSLPKQYYDVKLTPVLSHKDEMVILGRDFLAEFEETLVKWDEAKIKLGDNWVFQVDSPKVNPVINIDNCKINDCLSPAQSSCLKDIIMSHETVFAHNPRAPRECNRVKHYIRSTNVNICRSKVRRIPKKWEDDVNQQVEEMLQNGICQVSSSPYNSNIILVDKKSDKTKRFVIDFRELNKGTVRDSYPLPNVDDMIERCFGKKYFTQLDLASGYWGIPIAEEDKAKTAFSVPRGKFEFNRMPFGLINAQATFQRSMNEVVEEAKKRGAKGLDAYVDNILIFSVGFEEHLETINIVLTILDEWNFSLRVDKCEFALNSMEFLGFELDGKNLRPGSGNIDKLRKFPVPNDRKSLQRFLGLANFNRRFIKHYSDKVTPLNKLTSSKVSWVWTNKEQSSFENIKNELCSALSLHLPDWSRPFIIKTDASKVAVGSVLGQLDDNNNFIPIGYHSESLNPTARKWSATEREFYAIISASRKWRTYCCEKITFLTDHEPLKNISKQKDPRHKFGRGIAELENIDYVIQYIKGSDNVEADCMSRIPGTDTPEIPPAVYTSFQDHQLLNLLEAQRSDESIKKAAEMFQKKGMIKSGPYRRFSNLSIIDGLLCKGKRIIVPEAMTEDLIREYHGQAHLGVENTALLLSGKFYWYGMRKDIENLVSECRVCSQCKPCTIPKAPVQDHREITRPFQMIAIDLASMPGSVKGSECFLVVVDNYSKMTVAAALPDQRSETIISCLWKNWFSYYGIPEFLQSDQGRNVDGSAIRSLCENLGISKLRSSAYHPAGNGSAERAIGFIKTILRTMCLSRNISINHWDELLPEAMLHANATYNQSNKFSPFFILHGLVPVLPIDSKLQIKAANEKCSTEAIHMNVDLNRFEAKANYQKQANKNLVENEFKVGDQILLKRTHGAHAKANPYWVGPYTVTKKLGQVNWEIKDELSNKTKVVHHNLIKPALKVQNATIVPSTDFSLPVNERDMPRLWIDPERFQHNNQTSDQDTGIVAGNSLDITVLSESSNDESFLSSNSSPLRLQSNIDIDQFSNNVLNSDPSELLLPSQSGSIEDSDDNEVINDIPIATRSGRISRPPRKD